MMSRAICVAVSAAVLLAACGPGGGSKRTGMIDSCGVLKAIDAPAVIGVDFEPPEGLRDLEGGEDTGKMSSCGLTSSASKDDPASLADVTEQMKNTWFVTLMAWTWPSEAAAEGYMDSMRQSGAGESAPEQVTGVGDDAVWNGTMHARTANVTISLDIRGPMAEEGDKSEKALETELTQRALDNLD